MKKDFPGFRDGHGCESLRRTLQEISGENYCDEKEINRSLGAIDEELCFSQS